MTRLLYKRLHLPFSKMIFRFPTIWDETGRPTTVGKFNRLQPHHYQLPGGR